jgi:hypothetical protein
LGVGGFFFSPNPQIPAIFKSANLDMRVDYSTGS